MPTMSTAPSFWMASLATCFCSALPVSASEACMMSTSPPLPATLIDLMSQSTGRAFSTGVPW